MAASADFKASGFTDAVMQMNFWISHDLLHLNIPGSSLQFCVYFWRAQALLLHLEVHVVEEIRRVDLSRDHTVEMPREFLGGARSSWVSTLRIFGGHKPYE